MNDQPEDHVAPPAPERILTLKSGKAPQKGKRVRMEEVEDDGIPDRPNLVEIFDEYDLPDDERLALCVATAGFYRALLRKPKKK